jgi:hypothetical protein
VSAFFAELKLEQYMAAIAENDIDGHMLEELVVADGLSDLGVTKLHAIRIKRALKEAADDLAPQTGCAPVGANDNSGPSKVSAAMPLSRTQSCTLLCAQEALGSVMGIHPCAISLVCWTRPCVLGKALCAGQGACVL